MSLAKPASDLSAPTGQIVRFIFRGAKGRIAITTIIAEAFRSAALSALHAVAGSRNSFLLSGHRNDRKPDDQHRHAYYLPQFTANELVGLLLMSPHEPFSTEEMKALHMVRKVQWGGPSTRCEVELVEEDDLSARAVASRWRTSTPYVPLRRFWGTHGKRHLVPEKQLKVELEKLPIGAAITSVQFAKGTEVRIRLASRVLGTAPSRRMGFHAELTASIPISGPICLGHSCHFGLGLFVPERC